MNVYIKEELDMLPSVFSLQTHESDFNSCIRKVKAAIRYLFNFLSLFFSLFHLFIHSEFQRKVKMLVPASAWH